MKFCNIPCPYFFFPPINFLKPSSTLTQLFSFTASVALAMILLVKMATGCMLELSLYLHPPQPFFSPRNRTQKAEAQGIQKQFGGDCGSNCWECVFKRGSVCGATMPETLQYHLHSRVANLLHKKCHFNAKILGV